MLSQRRDLLILWTALAGVILMSNEVSCLRGSALVAELKAKAKAALNAPTETVIEVVTVENNSTGNVTNVTVTKTKSLLTGIPQKDYIYDPNLPRELNGQNLTNYPFYNAVPEDIDFKCDGLHDGFYASVPHKCQVYHHCLFGTRYDFLCANYTAFDQKTFICHFVSEVDCENSPKYYKRNEALYKAATSAPPPSTTKVTTTTTSSTPSPGQTARPRRRRPYRRRRPVYEYYYDDQYDDDDYYDEDVVQPPRRKPNRKNRPQGNHRGEDDEEYDSSGQQNTQSKDTGKPSVRPNGPAAGSVYDRPRVPPKIRRPVPLNEREKYDYTSKTTDMGPIPTQDTVKHRSQGKKQHRDDDYYDEDYEEEQPTTKKSKPVEYDSEPRRSNGRHRPRQHSRRRPDRYSDDYEEDERPLRPSRKQGRYDNYPRSPRPSRYRGYSRDDHEAVPAERPGYISGGRLGSVNRKRLESDSNRGGSRKNNGRPVYEDEDEEEYYDEEDESYEEEVASRRNQRPGRYNGRVPISEDDYDDDTRRRKPYENGNNRKNSGSSGKYNKPVSQDESPASSKHSEKLTQNHNRNEKLVSNTDSANNKDFIQDYDKEEDYDEEYEEKPFREASQSKGRVEENIESHTLYHDHNNNSTDIIATVPDNKDSVKFSQQSADFGTPENSQQIYPSRNNNRKPSVDEISTNSPKFKVSSTTVYSEGEYDDELPRYSNFRPKIEMKARIVPPTPLINNYRKSQTTINPIVKESPEIIGRDDRPHELVEKNNDQQDKDYLIKNEKPEDKFNAPTTPRPFVSNFRRPLKTATEPNTSAAAAFTNSSASEQNLSSQKNAQVVLSSLRRPVKDGEDDKLSRKTLPAGAFRRVKIDSSKPGNSDIGSTKVSQNLRRPATAISDIPNSGVLSPSNFDGIQSRVAPGNNFRRLNKVIDLTTTEISVVDSFAEDIENQPSAPDTNVKNIKEYEDNVQNQPTRTNTGTQFKGPYSVNNISTNSDDLPKFLPPLRRLNKQQNTQNIPHETTSEDYVSSTLSSVRNNGNYRRPEAGATITLRSNFGYFAKRVKQPPLEDTASISETFPTQGTRTNKEAFLKQAPKIEITAPGPSAPDNDPTTTKSNFRNNYNEAQNPVSDYGFHIPDEEYDVTLNDALQPSTLHPTRSLVDYEQNRLKSRGFQPAVVHPAVFTNRQTSFLLPAASQQYITRIQSTYPQGKPLENPHTQYADKTRDKFIQLTPQGQHEYEAVVISAPGSQQWTSQQNTRPSEWLW